MNDLLGKILELLRKIPGLSDFSGRIVSHLAVLLRLITFHYGCPNSKRTERLQLKKRIFK
jgi:hypothetical protein